MNRTPELHPDPEDLQSLALGKLDETRSPFTAIEEHVAICPECAAAMLRTQDDSFTALLRVAQTFSDTDLSRSAGSTLTISGAVGKEEPTDAWQEGDKAALSGAPSAELPAALANHPRYRPLRQLGQGGMGEVWLAEHKLMGRTVAVKVIRPEVLNRAGAAERFRREVQSAARLHHPNIVTAFDADQTGDAPLLAMEYVEGTNVADEVRRRGPLPVAEACALIRQTALGLQHAHDRGLVHRDLKPHNLMRTADGTVKILDFGLAVLHEAGPGQGNLTGANVVVGTPDYIAPEQAEDSRAADRRSDIYSLGCTLYHLLTGRVPFPEESVLKKLDAHRTRQPEPVRKVRPDVPEELARVVARMMARRPADRFASAAEVARALEPFTKPAAPPRRRRPLVVALAFLAIGLVLLAGVVFSIVTDKGTIEIHSDDENIKVIAARNGQEITLQDVKNKQTWVVDTGEWTVRLDGNPEGLKIELPHTFTLKRGGKQVVTVKRVSPPEPPPGAKWVKAGGTPNPAPEPPQEKVGEVRRTILGDRPGCLAVTPDGKQVLLGTGWTGYLTLRDVATGQEVRRFESHAAFVYGVAISPDGKFALSGAQEDSTIRYYDLQTGKILKTLQAHAAMDVAFSADGKRALSASFDNTARLWDLETGKELQRFEPRRRANLPSGEVATPSSGLRRAAFVPDGLHVLTASNEKDGAIHLWNIRTGKEVRRYEGHSGGVFGLAPLPDGKRFVSGSVDGTIRLWDIDKGTELHRFEGHRGAVHAVAVSADGRRILSAGWRDWTVRLWDVDTGKELQCFKGHGSDVLGVAFSPDGRYGYSCSPIDQVLIQWRLP